MPTPEHDPEVQLVAPETLTVATTAGLMREVIAKGITAESVGVMKELTLLMERADSRQAEKDFAKAFNALQAKMPRITADRKVPDKNGNLKYKFAAFEDIMEAISPLLIEFGFTVTFSMGYEGDRVIQTCTVQHMNGHSRSNSFAARIGSGPPGASAAQADGASSTYAKRFALCNAFNIIVETDTDAQLDVRQEGEPITPEQVAYLKETLKDTAFNEATFWTLAGVETGAFEKIRTGSYPVLSRAMEMKRGAKKS